MNTIRNKFASNYIVCEKYDFMWTREDIFKFERMWNDGKTLREMAKYFNRPQMEILFLAADRAEEGTITPRKGGLIGTVNPTKKGRKERL